MAGIFLSYRRSDSAGFAGRLYNDLREHFGSGYIFRDIALLIPGESFPKAIERALSTCHVLIVVIGQQWLTCVDAKGQRRLDDQEDFVRMEIEGAFTGMTTIRTVSGHRFQKVFTNRTICKEQDTNYAKIARY